MPYLQSVIFFTLLLAISCFKTVPPKSSEALLQELKTGDAKQQEKALDELLPRNYEEGIPVYIDVAVNHPLNAIQRKSEQALTALPLEKTTPILLEKYSKSTTNDKRYQEIVLNQNIEIRDILEKLRGLRGKKQNQFARLAVQLNYLYVKEVVLEEFRQNTALPEKTLPLLIALEKDLVPQTIDFLQRKIYNQATPGSYVDFFSYFSGVKAERALPFLKKLLLHPIAIVRLKAQQSIFLIEEPSIQ